ncbi:MAG: hypothetical protein QG649_799 [Patescibacteria group bacterium]|nr:hypothetical protein [Patescibacteria group bacterium]
MGKVMPKLPIASILRSNFTSGKNLSKRIVKSFAEEHGLVCFGYVSQRTDEHHIVRGMTVSTKHHDDHYCIGTFDGYDVVFVERADTLQTGKKHIWHIMEFDLRVARDIPHVFIGPDRHGNGFHELLSIKYSSMQPAQLGATAQYPDSFAKSFTLYCTPAHAIEIEQVINPELAHTIATHYEGLVLEIAHDSLFVYSERSHMTPALLSTMLKNGVWLAEKIDQKSQHV